MNDLRDQDLKDQLEREHRCHWPVPSDENDPDDSGVGENHPCAMPGIACVRFRTGPTVYLCPKHLAEIHNQLYTYKGDVWWDGNAILNWAVPTEQEWCRQDHQD